MTINQDSFFLVEQYRTACAVHMAAVDAFIAFGKTRSEDARMFETLLSQMNETGDTLTELNEKIQAINRGG